MTDDEQAQQLQREADRIRAKHGTELELIYRGREGGRNARVVVKHRKTGRQSEEVTEPARLERVAEELLQAERRTA